MSLRALLINPVVLRVAVSYANVRGVRTPAYAEATLSASVQEMSTSRVHLHGLEGSTGGYTLYFDAPPGVTVDETFHPAAVGDVIVWGATTLSCLGGAKDEAGRGRVYSLDCREQE